MKLGLTLIPVHVVTDLTAEQVKAYRIADNKTGEIAEWDFEILPIELSELQNFGFDMTTFGFSEKELAALLETDLRQGLTDPDTVPDPLDDTITQPGDLWILGDHRVYCGDCTKQDSFTRLTKKNKARVLLTDPPYNVNYVEKSSSIDHTIRKTEKYREIENDHMSDDNFCQFLLRAFVMSAAHLVDGGTFYIWHADTNRVCFQNACDGARLAVKQNLIWCKNHFVLGRQDYQWQHEPCLYGWKEGAAHYWGGGRNKTTTMEEKIVPDKMKKEELIELVKRMLTRQCNTTVLHEDKPLKSGLHPTMKPVGLFVRLIHNSSKSGEIILDPFAGSGTSVIACEQTNRRCFAMEIDPNYVDIIVRRWKNFTGREAVRETTSGNQ